MLDSLRCQAMGFAPKRELNVSSGVFPRRGLRRLIGFMGSDGRVLWLAAVAEHRTTKHDCVDHGFLAGLAETNPGPGMLNHTLSACTRSGTGAESTRPSTLGRMMVAPALKRHTISYQ